MERMRVRYGQDRKKKNSMKECTTDLRMRTKVKNRKKTE